MADQTPLLGLPYILPSQSQKHVTHNEALSQLDIIVQLAVVSRTLNTPPTTPATGDRYIVSATATSAWQGHEGEVALWTGSAWTFAVPKAGWAARDLSDAAVVVFDGNDWAEPALNLNNLPGVGINASADATNRLTVFAASTLLSHDGAGHQVKVNKLLSTDTASLLFQTSWSGRAEMGTTGSDNFGIKVSANGSSWTTALSFAAASGIASGAAVQQSKTDTTAGRLMRADYGYGPGNVLGTVTQASGVPGGAVLERGSTANGEYLRLADGTQICFTSLTLGSISGLGSGSWASPYRSPDASWTFPKPFSAVPVVSMRGVPPAGLTVDRRSCVSSVGDTSTTAATGIHVMRIGTSNSPDVFLGDMLAIGRWF